MKAMNLPSGDQSGSVQFKMPPVFSLVMVPPLAGMVNRAALPSAVEVKQIVRPSGDQQGEASYPEDLVN